ncbi:hypothetical protein AB0M26_31720, partial [Streptomyces sp. NPDC051776]
GLHHVRTPKSCRPPDSSPLNDASSPQPKRRGYYDKKRREGKHHVAAIVALARRRIDVLFAMLRDGTFYQPPAPVTA